MKQVKIIHHCGEEGFENRTNIELAKLNSKNTPMIDIKYSTIEYGESILHSAIIIYDKDMSAAGTYE